MPSRAGSSGSSVFGLVVRRGDGGLELELRHPQRDHVAVAQEAPRRPLAVHQHAVLRSEIDDLELGPVDGDSRVLAGYRAVEDADAVLRAAAEGDDLPHRLP